MYTMIIGKPPFETSDVKTTYKRIRMNMYSFPENIPISEPARDLITRILNTDPSKRPKLDDFLEHPFIRHEGTIPRLLPASTLACPPSSTYIRQFQPQGGAKAQTSSLAGGSQTQTAPTKANDMGAGMKEVTQSARAGTQKQGRGSNAGL
jgi:polo-like kinase 1